MSNESFMGMPEVAIGYGLAKNIATCLLTPPFLNNGWRKHILLKYNKNFNYSYNEEKIIGGISNHHPLPEIMPEPIKNTEDFYIIHYGKIALQYISGETIESSFCADKFMIYK